MVVIVDLADRKGNLGVEYMRKMSEGGRGGGGVRCMEEERGGKTEKIFCCEQRRFVAN